MGEADMNFTKAVTDGFNWYPEHADQYRSHYESNERCRHLVTQTGPQAEDQQRAGRYRDGIRIDGVEPGGVEAEALDEFGGSTGELQAEHITKLLNDQDRRDSGSEAGHNRKRYELDGSA